MATAVIGALVIVVIGCYWLARIGRTARASWFLVRLWRWLSGEAHHGKPVTDAGWFRHGHKPLTPTGHATRWWHLPRWKRAAWRTGGTLAVVGWLAAFIVNWLVTAIVTAAALAVTIGLSAYLAVRALRIRKNRRTWLLPLHLAAHEIAGIPRAIAAESWITVRFGEDEAVNWAQLEPGPGWQADPKDEKRLEDIAAKRLGIESAEATWRRSGPVPLLTLAHSPPPPGHVKLADLLEEMAKCRDDELVLGVGKNGEIVRASLGTDSPHIALSMGTGAGKSNLAGFLLLQILVRGGVGLVLDAKRRLSYPWILKDMERQLRQLPNVGYAWTTAQLHEGMAWLGDELDRRGDVAFAGMDTRGKVGADVGARMLTIAEELNLAAPRLKDYWSEARTSDDPKKSPAFTGLGATAFAGRQVRKHLVLVGQMLTAEVTGSRDSSVKGQCGIKLMARYDLKGWRIMCGDIPMPPPPTTLGRIQVVTASGVWETQTPELDPVMARQMVLDGIVSKLPPTMPRSLVTGIPALVGSGPPPAAEIVSEPLPVTGGPVLVGLREAVEKGHLSPQTTLGSLRMERFRHRDSFPRPHREPGRNEDLFDLAELVEYDAGRG